MKCKCRSVVYWLGSTLMIVACVCCSLDLRAQKQSKQIRLYHVVVNTNKGRVKGILERTTPTRMYISSKSGKYIALDAVDIKRVRVKEYPRKKRTVDVPILEPGLTAYTDAGFLTSEYMRKAPSLTENIGYSVLGITLVNLFGLIHNSFSNLATFRPNCDISRYRTLISEISGYAVYNQNMLDYEIELLKRIQK